MNEKIQDLTDKIIAAISDGIGTSQILANPERFTKALIDLKQVQVLEQVRSTIAQIKVDLNAQLPAIIALVDQLKR